MAPGLVTEYTAIRTDNTISIGIINFDTRSIPFRTPAKMIVRVNRQNRIKQSSVDTPSEINSEKYPSAASIFPFPLIYSIRYLITQPPITE